jgi:hypothetical protein
MAYNANELRSTATGIGSGLRLYSTSTQPKTFAMGSGTIAKATPVTYNDATRKWNVWAGGTSEVNVLTAASTVATDGTFDLTINGVTIADLDHDVSTTDLDTAITTALGLAAGDLTVAEAGGGLDANDGTCTLTWAGAMAEQDVDISADFTNITGNAHVLSSSTEGTSNRIDGFVWPDDVVLDSDEEVMGQVMLTGRAHVGDIVVPSGETQGSLNHALRERQVRDSGIIIEGLVGFH